MSEYKELYPNRCRICGEKLTAGEAVEWVKHKSTKFYVHTKCLKKRRPKK